MQSCVLGAKKRYKGVQDAILWHVFVVKISAICALALGNPIIKTILSVTFIKKAPLRRLVEKRKYYKK
jgi:hypothetical protein